MSALDEKTKKRLLLLGGGYEQINAVRVARELGADVIVFDGNAKAPCSYEATEFFQVNIKNRTELIEKAASCNIDGVFVHAAELAVECAAIAEHLNLPGISLELAALGTDKTKRSARLKTAGVRVPAFCGLANDETHLVWRKKATDMGYPLIVKPAAMAGARGVEFIEDEAALDSYYERKNEFEFQDFQLEEFVEGVQLSTETVVIEGRLEETTIALRHYDTTGNLWPFQIEDGHSMPWNGCPEIRGRIASVVEQCCMALGMQNGVLKGDLVVTECDEIIVLEMAVRTSGGRFCDTVVPLSSGVNILYPLIQYALGQEADTRYLQAFRCNGVSQRFVFLEKGTPLRKQKHIENILLQPSVVGSWFRDDIQELVAAPAIRSHRDRLGYVICTGSTQAEADENAKRIVAEIAAALVMEK